MKNLFAFLLALLALVSCTRELNPVGPDPREGITTLSASLSAVDSKTNLYDLVKVTWEAGDAIAVYSSDGNGPYKFTVVESSIDKTTGTAIFEGSMPSAVSYCAIYPYNADFKFDGTQISFTTPSSSTLRKDGFVNGANIAVAPVTSGGLSFKNVCTLMKLMLRTGVARTVTLSTNDDACGLQGSYKVDPATLALTRTSVGKTITLTNGSNLESGVYYIPVPYYDSKISDCTIQIKNADGVVLDSRTYSNFDLFRNCICNCSDFGTGIVSASDLAAFRDAVNAGASLAPFTADGSEGGDVVLLNDIDCSALGAWEPIGNGVVQTPASGQCVLSSGRAFTGTFDGQGHAIRNINLTNTAISNGAYGLFGVVNGGTVKNFVLGDESSDAGTFDVKGASVTTGNGCCAGVIAGVVMEGTVSGCSNYIPMISRGSTYTSGRFNSGIVGYASASLLENIVNYAGVSALQGSNTASGANDPCVNFGAIAGFVTSPSGDSRSTVNNCLNYGDIASECSSSAGIVGRVYNYSDITNCINYGDQIHDGNQSGIEGRIGNVIAYIHTNINVTNCENQGDLTLKYATTRGGGVVGHATSANSYVISYCSNYGKITGSAATGSTTYTSNKFGLLVGYLNGPSSGSVKTVMHDCTAGGTLWNYNSGSPIKYDVNDSNYLQYIGGWKTAYENVENIKFINSSNVIEISTAAQLADFASKVNSGEYTNVQARLTADIDMSSYTTWTPIGNGTLKNSNSYITLGGNCFTGVFDGQGHTIKNFKVTCTNTTDYYPFGLFGIINGGEVKNIVFDSSCTFTNSAGALTDTGILAGALVDGKVIGVSSSATLKFTNVTVADDKKMDLGIIGFVYANTCDTYVCAVVNNGSINADACNGTVNNQRSYQIGGIAGMSITNNKTNTTCRVKFDRCVNNAEIISGTCRNGGIAATALRRTDFIQCENNGSLTSNSKSENSANNAGICGWIAEGSGCEDCVNNGQILSTTGTRAAGVACYIADAACYLRKCSNYGLIITDLFTGDKSNYCGALFGQCTVASEFTDCVSNGKVALFSAGSYVLLDMNASNYMKFCGEYTSDATNVTTANIRFAGADTPASEDFTVSPASGNISAGGTEALMVSLSSKYHDWTVSSSESWLTVKNASMETVTSGSASQNMISLSLWADANNTSSPRTATVTFTNAVSQTTTVTVTQKEAKISLTGKWQFSASRASIYSTAWTENGLIPATNGTAARISVVSGSGSKTFGYTLYNNVPVLAGMTEGDYYLFETPISGTLAAGTSIQFNVSLVAAASRSPKYFIMEIYDGGQWKCVEDETYSVSENPSLKYSFRLCNSTGQYGDGDQIFTLSNNVSGSLKMRLRVVGSYAVDGTTLNASDEKNKVKFAAMCQEGAYITGLGTGTPSVKKKILCLGNSFTFYSVAPWLLQEIAFREGLQLELCEHLKGSQTFRNHIELELSQEVIKKGSFDFAILQDQSTRPAHYADDPTTYSYVETDCIDLVNLVASYSPSCTTYIENTWAFSNNNYANYGSYALFDQQLQSGTASIAAASSSKVSPVGQAFEYSRATYPGINLYYSDNKHPGEYGAYLKACVNYLMISGKSSFTSSEIDCGRDAAKAAQLRAAAVKAVADFRK